MCKIQYDVYKMNVCKQHKILDVIYIYLYIVSTVLCKRKYNTTYVFPTLMSIYDIYILVGHILFLVILYIFKIY